VIENANGRVDAGVYVTGWAKTGPVGVVDSTLRASTQAMALIKSDIEAGVIHPKPDDPISIVPGHFTTYADWERIDAQELAHGAQAGKLREKTASLDEMLKLIGR
jgi:ferredoxin--NADP+ reductase